MQEVAITGFGVVSPIGNTVETFSVSLFSGVSGVGTVTRFDPSRFSCRLAAQVDESELRVATGPYAHEIDRMDRFVRFALTAAREAVAHSGLFPGTAPPTLGGIFMGVGMGGLPHIEEGVLSQEIRGPRKTTPYLIPSLIASMAAGMVSLEIGFTGPQLTFGSACSSGLQALGEAMYAIRSGRIEWALAGGAEAVITPITFSGFQAMRALSTHFPSDSTPRPFDRRRDGMVVGEGAAVFVLETRQRALARGARLHGALCGYATASGGGSLSRPCSETAIRCMQAALKDSRLAPDNIDAIWAHAPGMVHDHLELAAIREVFHEVPGPRPVTSLEGHIGHTFAASGPLSLAAALLACRRGEMPQILHLDEPEPGFDDLDLARQPRPGHFAHCLINSFGFGGINASLICRGPASASELSSHPSNPAVNP